MSVQVRSGGQWIAVAGAQGPAGPPGPPGPASTVPGPPGSSGVMTLNARTSAYTLQSTDDGKLVTTTSGNITVPASTFVNAAAVTIFNASNASINIIQGSSTTMYLAGTTVTGNRTLAAKGLCTIVCTSSNNFVAAGGGLT